MIPIDVSSYFCNLYVWLGTYVRTYVYVHKYNNVCILLFEYLYVYTYILVHVHIMNKSYCAYVSQLPIYPFPSNHHSGNENSYK